MTLKTTNVTNVIKDKLYNARFSIELFITQQRAEMAARSIRWHYKKLLKARQTLDSCARHEIDMFGGLPAEEEMDDYLAERKNFIRILEETTR
jgi:hypothetical protein|tara:strand:- start:1462 stop:1740 length:279 start_codon:yes stop_codon:yes gene_type:complete